MSLFDSSVQPVGSSESHSDKNSGAPSFIDVSENDQLHQGEKRAASPAVIGGQDGDSIPVPKPANLQDFNQLQPTPRCLPPPEKHNIDATDIGKSHMDVGEAEILEDVNVSEEVLVLDEVGFCEKMEAGVQPGGANCDDDDALNLCDEKSIQPQATSTIVDTPCSYYKVPMAETKGMLSSSNEPKEELPSNGTMESDDDILSIMCEDNEDNILLGGDVDPSSKRQWTFDSRCTSKRNRDSPPNTSKPSDYKRFNYSSRNPSESNGRQRNGPVHSRLGKPKYYQSIRIQRPCYNFVKTGNCFRESCQFLHSAPKQDAIRNRSGYNVDNSILGNPSSYHLLAMQRQLREQQLQLQQHQAQHQTLVEHVYQNELNLKQYAASQANEVFDKMQESLHHLQEQYDQQDQMCQLVGHLTSLEDRVRELECAQSNRQDLLTHYQFIADFQQHQLQQLIGEQNGSIRSDKITSGRQSCPPLPDLRQVMPLKNSGACRPPRPRSADVENQQSLTWNACPPNYVKSDPNTQRPRSADNLRSSRPEYFASSRPQARLPSQTQCEYPPDAAAFQRLPSMSRSPVESSFHHAASSSRVVRILPLRHTPAPTFDEFQPQHSIYQPSSRGM